MTVDVSGLRELLKAANDPGLSIPGEPAWGIENWDRGNARAQLENYNKWLPQLLAEHEAMRKALERLANDAEAQLCQHESTHRGGVLWTICDECGRKWADDEGGFAPYQEPEYIARARAALSPLQGYPRP